MMVTTQGEDYVTLAQMRGLKPSRVFSLYGMRNATLPQLTSLALAMSLIFSGVILVEVIYRYPGMGTPVVQRNRRFRLFRHLRCRLRAHRDGGGINIHPRHRLSIHRPSRAPRRMNRRFGRDLGTNDA